MKRVKKGVKCLSEMSTTYEFLRLSARSLILHCNEYILQIHRNFKQYYKFIEDSKVVVLDETQSQMSLQINKWRLMFCNIKLFDVQEGVNIIFVNSSLSIEEAKLK